MTASALAHARWLTPPTVARILAVKCETVHGWIRRGELRAISVSVPGKRPRYRVDPVDLEAFIARRAVVPPAPAARKRRPQTTAKDYFS